MTKSEEEVLQVYEELENLLKMLPRILLVYRKLLVYPIQKKENEINFERLLEELDQQAIPKDEIRKTEENFAIAFKSYHAYKTDWFGMNMAYGEISLQKMEDENETKI